MTVKKKTNNGRFSAGKSGNPAGRPLGIRNQRTLFLESPMDGDAESLIRKVVELAKAGNLHALGMCMDRLLPVAKDRTVQFDLPPSETLKDVSSGMRSITAAVCEGQLTPNEGETISRTLVLHADVMVYEDLQGRVEKLERGPSAKENKIEIVRSQR